MSTDTISKKKSNTVSPVHKSALRCMLQVTATRNLFESSGADLAKLDEAVGLNRPQKAPTHHRAAKMAATQ